ncbi:MAG TPA: hypothetical protein PLL30_03720 [Candidatus Krumholzibacteria bacterium]|nr:hypothetical protein [Candidatus Krumholzibacteria bacterium]HPD70882.1 hypothetical protein [Candidatus Krumholzibacteria bacterium]HRY39418.1 hypothetical protein [Candidatus Krumholzibacteria bacterium]
MRVRSTTTALSLVLAFPVLASAAELPAQAQRIWAPTGDQIGLSTHATATLVAVDDQGDRTKAAEDRSMRGETFGSGVFGWQWTAAGGHQLVARGAGGNVEGSGFAGNAGLWSTAPGRYSATFTASAHDRFYDRDSELRAPAFAYPPAPPALGFDPHLAWRSGRGELRYHVADGLDLNLGVAGIRRDGEKGSLLRGAAGAAAPARSTVDTRQYEAWLGAAFRAGALGSTLRVDVRDSDGDRDVAGRHVYADDRRQYGGRLDLSYDVCPATRILAHGALARLESGGSETWSAGTSPIDGDTDRAAGQLALLTRLGQSTTLRLSARVRGLDTEIRADQGSGVLAATERDGDGRDFQVMVDNGSIPSTRLQLQYRFGTDDLSSVTAQGGLPGSADAGDQQSLDKETSREELSLRARTRLSRQAKLRAAIRWTRKNVDEESSWTTASGDPWYGTLGDHEIERLAWDVALQTRPHRNLPIDLGYQGRDQTLDRTVDEADPDDGVATTWQANRLFLNANWLAHQRLSVYGMVAYGLETYELVGVQEPAGGLGAFDYDGATLRFIPGAVLQLGHGIQLEGMYEAVYFENTGDESSSLAAVQSDRDNILARARWQARPALALSLAYRRHELDENRWDDYIQDVYSVSVSAQF